MLNCKHFQMISILREYEFQRNHIHVCDIVPAQAIITYFISSWVMITSETDESDQLHAKVRLCQLELFHKKTK